MLDVEERGTRARRRRARRQKARDRRRTVLAALLVISLLVSVGFFGWWGYGKVRDFLITPDYSGQGSGEVLIRVNPGDSAQAIGQTLKDEGVVKSVAAFTEAAAQEPRAALIQPGTYKLRAQMSGLEALALLLNPASKIAGGVTIPEGKSALQTFEILHKELGVPVEDFVEAAADPASLGAPEWAKDSGSIEGLLFPDTYDFSSDADATDILSTMVERAKEVLGELDVEGRAGGLGRTPYEIVTIASLVEGEGITSDFGKISRVVYNRLATEPYLLNFDSTTQYWLEKEGKGRKRVLTNAELRDTANNYSTTINPGLPPTAIANPGRLALEAAMNPEPGPWMYFVLVSEDGHSAFAVTESEHNANVQICREKDLGC